MKVGSAWCAILAWACGLEEWGAIEVDLVCAHALSLKTGTAVVIGKGKVDAAVMVEAKADVGRDTTVLSAGSAGKNTKS